MKERVSGEFRVDRQERECYRLWFTRGRYWKRWRRALPDPLLRRESKVLDTARILRK